MTIIVEAKSALKFTFSHDMLHAKHRLKGIRIYQRICTHMYTYTHVLKTILKMQLDDSTFRQVRSLYTLSMPIPK